MFLSNFISFTCIPYYRSCKQGKMPVQTSPKELNLPLTMIPSNYCSGVQYTDVLTQSISIVCIKSSSLGVRWIHLYQSDKVIFVAKGLEGLLTIQSILNLHCEAQRTSTKEMSKYVHDFSLLLSCFLASKRASFFPPFLFYFKDKKKKRRLYNSGHEFQNSQWL